ncbi:MAG: (2Fe-2S) ferredoxin domain-containing protein [Clostridia bacterium]
MKLAICMGTTCHLRGSREIIEQLQQLISDNNLKDKVDMSGKFCLGRCSTKGVSVNLDGKDFDLTPEETKQFFDTEILGRLK